MDTRSAARIAIDISDETLRELFLQALSGYGISPSQPGEAAAVIVKDRAAEAAPANVPVIQLWQTGRARKNTGENPFASTAARNWIAASPAIRGEEVSTTVAHLFEHRFIGLQQLIPNPTDMITLREQSSATKHEHMSQLRSFLEKHEAGKHLIESMELAFEEMFTNAAYNAPVDATGNHPHAGKSRTQGVISERPFVIEYRVDEHHVGLCVRDAYGTLGAERVLDCLRRCYSQGGAQFEEKEGGAGLGFYMLLQQATRMVVNVKAGQFTEVIILRRRGENRRQFMSSTPTLNLCFVTGEGAATTSRRYARMSVRWPGAVVVDGVERAAVALDVSPGGAFLVFEGTLDGLDPGKEISVTLSPSASRPSLTARARVRWAGISSEHRSPGIGVEFDPPLATSDVFGA